MFKRSINMTAWRSCVFFKNMALSVGLLMGAPTWAQSDFGDEFGQDLSANRWETGLALAGVTALGIYSWDWGSSKTFKVNDEGWFGEDTGSGGADKLGHAFSSYAMTNLLADRLAYKGRSPERAARNAALTTQAVMLYVEIFDGYSGDHGFSKEDMVMNALGSGLAYARAAAPGLRELIDFRLEYEASGYKGYRPLSDYSGQKYVLALKLSGIRGLNQSLLRHFELQTGYYTRGFSKEEKADGLTRQRHQFVGIGLNLNQLLFGNRTSRENELRHAGRLFFEHIQVPYTAARQVSER
jgi:hypothetical protein